MAGNAEYVIDIAAQLAGDETLAELDELTSELMGAGKGAEFFQQAIQQASRALDAASADSAAANAALADGQAEYRRLEAAANQAAKTVEKLGLKGDTMSSAYLKAARASATASDALGVHAAKLVGLEDAAAGATAKEEKLSATLAGVTKLSSHVDSSIADQAKEWRALGGVLGQLPGPLGGLGRAFAAGEAAEARFASRFGADAGMAVKLGLGLAGVTAAVIALSAALAVGAVKIAEYAIGLADSRRNADLAIEAMQVMQPELAGLTGTISDVSQETGMHADELNGLAGALFKAGKSADQMDDALRAAAYSEAALGKGASQGYLTLVQAATDAQKAVDEAASKSGGAVDKQLTKKLNDANKALDDFEQKAVTGLGGVVARQLQGISAQSQRLETNLSDIFGGLDIDPVLAGMSKLVALFDKNSETGRAVKLIFDTIFQPLIDGADDAATAIEAFVLGFLIGAMKIYLAIKPAIKAVEEFFGLDSGDLTIDFKTLTAVGEALAPVFLLIAAVVGGALAAAFVAIGAVIAAQVAIWYGLVKAISFVVDFVVSAGKMIYNAIVEPFNAIAAFLGGEIDFATLVNRLIMNVVNVITGLAGLVLSSFVSLMTGPLSYLTGIDLSGMGRNLIMGFVRGITGALGAVVSAVTNVMGSAISAAKNVLGIHSPSTVFRDDIAGNVVEGAVTGTEDGAPEMADAYATMLEVPPANDIAPSPADLLKQAQLSGDTATVERLQGVTSPADVGSPQAPQAPGGEDGGGKGGGADLSHATFNFYGLPDAKGAIDAFSEMLDAAVEGDAAKLGAAAARGKQAA